MPKVDSAITFTGKLGDLSFYRMRGVDKIVVRRKGGPREAQIKNSRKFDIVRRNNSEFAGRSAGTKWVRKMLSWLKPLGDTDFTSRLSSLMKPLQEMDTLSVFGRRAILFSTGGWLLEGFYLNKENNFDSIVRNAVTASLSKADGAAIVNIPELIPGINFVVPGRYPVFRMIAVLGVLPDLIYNGNRYAPVTEPDNLSAPIEIETDWIPVLSGSAAQTLELKIDKLPADNSNCLILSVGIAFGTISAGNVINQVRYAGAAKVMKIA